MKVERLTRVRQVGVFRDFAWPEGLQEFRRLNLIFGANGSGKTTLSRIFRAIGGGELVEGEIEFLLDGESRRICAGATPDFDLPQVKVFNREYVERVIGRADGVTDPIFIVGEEEVAMQRLLEAGREQRAVAERNLEAAAKDAEKDENALSRFLSNEAKSIKQLLTDLGQASAYNNYDRSRLLDQITRLRTDPTAREVAKDADRALLRARCEQTALPDIEQLDDLDFDAGRAWEEVEGLVATALASKVIDSIAADNRLNHWVREGLEIHQDGELNNCGFCGGPFTTLRKEELEGHFDSAYTDLQSALNSQIDDFRAWQSALLSVVMPKALEFYVELRPEFEEASSEFEIARAAALELIDSTLALLEQKRQTPFSSLSFQRPVTDGLPDPSKVNALISRHRERTGNLSRSVRESQAGLEAALAYERLEEFERLSEQVRLTSTFRSIAELVVEGMSESVRRVEQLVRNHEKSAEEITSDLSIYLGHDCITLKVVDEGYVILREGEVAERLSEGEQTAIALVHFIRSLDGDEFDKTSGIVVVDDPVSSMDASALHHAAGFLRSRTSEVGQLIVLTHNFEFFKLIRTWLTWVMQREKKSNPPTGPSLYSLLTSSISPRESDLRDLDPLLKDFESEYHYLFSQVYKTSKLSGEQEPLACFYPLPNVARRVLESFISFKKPDFASSRQKPFFDAISDLDKSGDRAQSITSFLNAHSHERGTDVGGPHDLSNLSEAPIVMEKIVAVMRDADPEHVQGMEAVLVEFGVIEHE